MMEIIVTFRNWDLGAKLCFCPIMTIIFFQDQLYFFHILIIYHDCFWVSPVFIFIIQFLNTSQQNTPRQNLVALPLSWQAFMQWLYTNLLFFSISKQSDFGDMIFHEQSNNWLDNWAFLISKHNIGRRDWGYLYCELFDQYIHLDKHNIGRREGRLYTVNYLIITSI